MSYGYFLWITDRKSYQYGEVVQITNKGSWINNDFWGYEITETPSLHGVEILKAQPRVTRVKASYME